MGYPLWGQVPMVLSVLTIFFYADWTLERGWRTEGTSFNIRSSIEECLRFKYLLLKGVPHQGILLGAIEGLSIQKHPFHW